MGKKNEENSRDLGDGIKCTSIHLTGRSRKREETGAEKIIWRNNGQKLPKFEETCDLHVQEAPWSPSRINSKNYTLKHVPVKLSKDNDRILQAARRELTPNLLLETVRLEAEGWLLKCWKKKLSTMKSTSSKITPQKWDRN